MFARVFQTQHKEAGYEGYAWGQRHPLPKGIDAGFKVQEEASLLDVPPVILKRTRLGVSELGSTPDYSPQQFSSEARSHSSVSRVPSLRRGVDELDCK